MKPSSWFLFGSVLSAVAPTGAAASDMPVPVVVVIHNHAGVAPPVLGRAIQATADAFRPLGIGIAWIRPPASLPDGTVVHLSILQRTAQGRSAGAVVGIDAPVDAGAPTHLAHILYRRVGNDAETGNVLAYVMAHLIARAIGSTDAASGSTIIRADRQAGLQMRPGASPFTPEQAAAIRSGAASRMR
jgi:hypothetical protein